jgi:kinesin family protein 4/21/27
VEQVCRQLQDDIVKMKGHKAAVMRRMEQREREFREWRAARERELAQLRRSAQRQNAALQQHQAMHLKQQAVLKRKTEEAEAAKKRLRELIEVQARARCAMRAGACIVGGAGQAVHSVGCGLRAARRLSPACSVCVRCAQRKRTAPSPRPWPAKSFARPRRNQRADAAAARGGELEMQPNAGAPLLRSERARREWVEQELDLCNTSWEYMKVGGFDRFDRRLCAGGVCMPECLAKSRLRAVHAGR